ARKRGYLGKRLPACIVEAGLPLVVLVCRRRPRTAFRPRRPRGCPRPVHPLLQLHSATTAGTAIAREPPPRPLAPGAVGSARTVICRRVARTGAPRHGRPIRQDPPRRH